MPKSLVEFVVIAPSGDEIKLEVGDHSPVWVVKEELERQTSIPKTDQMLCLLNDQGDDGALLEDGEATIRQCGITNGSSILLSCLTGLAPPMHADRAPRAHSSSVGTSPPIVDEATLLDETRVVSRARDECRAWCAELSMRRRQARERERQVERESEFGEPDDRAPVEISEGQKPISMVLATTKTPQRAEVSAKTPESPPIGNLLC